MDGDLIQPAWLLGCKRRSDSEARNRRDLKMLLVPRQRPLLVTGDEYLRNMLGSFLVLKEVKSIFFSHDEMHQSGFSSLILQSLTYNSNF